MENMHTFKQEDLEIDLSQLQEIGEEDKAFMFEALDKFIQQLNEIRKSYHEAMREGDYETMRQVHHKFKPSLELIKIPALNKIFEQSREMLYDNEFQDPQQNRLMADQMEEAWSILIPKLARTRDSFSAD